LIGAGEMKSVRARWLAGPLFVGALLGLAGPACAQIELITPETVHGVIDMRLVAADGEPSFTDGGFGKARYGGDGRGGWRVRGDLAQAAIEWRPRLNWEWSAVVDAAYQPGQSQAVDLVQAYIVYKPVPRSQTRISARLGLFYPPISLEHDAPVWGVTNTITSSAINSWVGEEVKVAGLEATVERDFGGQALSLTGALFGGDDTAGTLLTYRGWAMHDLKSTLGGDFGLPPLSDFAASVQPSETYSSREIDRRGGYYARLDWRPQASLDLHLFHYDNRGDRVSVDNDGQWAWATAFTEAGAQLQLGAKTIVLAQALTGRTSFGFPTPAGLFADAGFRAAYALVSRDVGKATLTGRADLFSVADHTAQSEYGADERGWALTAAARYPIGAHADLRLEALHIWSNRPARDLANLAAAQAQTILQSSLRLSF